MFSQNIYLLGFMGAGKSTVGKLLADKLGLKFFDLDEYIVEQQGCSINHIFDECGEAVFRRYESIALAKLSLCSGCVFSTGGGIIGSDINWQIMQDSGVTIFLRCNWLTLVERLSGSTERPLVIQNDLDALKELYQNRLLKYQKADYILDTDRLKVDEVVDKIEGILAKEVS